MDILKRQKQMAEQGRLMREAQKQAEIDAQQQKLSARPPRAPMGPFPDVSQGIAFLPRRTTGKGRKRKSKKTRRNRRSKK